MYGYDNTGPITDAHLLERGFVWDGISSFVLAGKTNAIVYRPLPEPGKQWLVRDEYDGDSVFIPNLEDIGHLEMLIDCLGLSKNKEG